MDFRIAIINNLTAIIIALIPVVLTLGGKYYAAREQKKKGMKKDQRGLSSWWPVIAALVFGLFLGYMFWSPPSPHPPPPDTILWSFDKSSESWTYFRQPQDASTNASWDAATQSLRAEFDFKNVDLSALPEGSEPRATFWVEGLDYDWTGYNKLVVDVANLDSQLSEMTFSFYVGECFYEFGGIQNIPPQPELTSITFTITEAKYKTCTSDQAFNSPPNLAGIDRFYLIIGTNEDPTKVKGAVLIDNIRLQKSPVEPSE